MFPKNKSLDCTVNDLLFKAVKTELLKEASTKRTKFFSQITSMVDAAITKFATKGQKGQIFDSEEKNSWGRRFFFFIFEWGKI